MKLPELDSGQKDIIIVMSCLFGGFSLLVIAIGICAWLMSLGGC